MNKVSDKELRENQDKTLMVKVLENDTGNKGGKRKYKKCNYSGYQVQDSRLVALRSSYFNLHQSNREP